MIRECPACPGLSWDVPAQIAPWFEHVRSAEHEAASRTPDGKARIAGFWAAKDADEHLERTHLAGMLF